MNYSIPKKDIMEKYGLSHSRYCKYGKDVYKETGFKRSAGVTPRNKYTNIRESGYGAYRIDKQVMGRKLYCGTYPTLDKAMRVRDFLIEHNWTNDAIEYCMNGGSI